MSLCELIKSKLATKIYDLATKFFPLVNSWLPNEKVDFEPWLCVQVSVAFEVETTTTKL